MGLTLLTGGARSGKSRLALRLVAHVPDVTFVATAEPGDDEMAARIAAHRAERPAGWTTVEAPRAPAEALAGVTSSTVVLDCLTLWVANRLLDEADPDAVGDEAAALADLLAGFATAVVVTNEVGLGIVPADPLSRRYRDLLGAVNAVVADRAETVLLCVAGRALRLPAAPPLPHDGDTP